ncbi:hypothetical protein KXD93_07220 [Mucilaginibacter sp. BJC16-A38]|uniref:hypothetical protein n=1 Tax=Mucilaginibacter phenanthrenivorans TaxID=1234842 RepID=UPI0021580449|nr:hypothetical protein [Mucilaginibacter phenanthrenivorans]MCR8557425.1 hypothetical protein [Mucilaginibacter phenanthrenivorans]
MKVIILTALLFLGVAVNAQERAATFQNAAKNNLTVDILNKQYKNALDADSNKSAFKGAGQQKFYAAYVALLTDLNTYLHKHDYTWQKPTRIIHRIYFEADGTIDHYLLNMDGAGMSALKQTQFITLLNQFVNNYKLKIIADTKFAQCGPAIYQD